MQPPPLGAATNFRYPVAMERRARATWGIMACALWATVSCTAPASQRDPEQTRLVLSIPFTGAWESIGRALASSYGTRLPHVRPDVVMGQSLESQVDAMQAGTVDLALEDAETAYLAYSSGTPAVASPHTALRAIGVLFSIAVQIAVPAQTGITSIDQLRGRRVDVGAPGGSVDRASRIILESYGFGFDRIVPVASGSDTLAQFRSGTLDARVFYSAFKHPVIDDISRDVDVRVLPIDRRVLGAIQERHHFLKTTTIPAGTYRNQTSDVRTVGMDVLLLCRQDLSESLAYDLTRALFESVPALQQAHESAGLIDAERGPTAPIPLHPGAARYYREREILK